MEAPKAKKAKTMKPVNSMHKYTGNSVGSFSLLPIKWFHVVLTSRHRGVLFSRQFSLSKPFHLTMLNALGGL